MKARYKPKDKNLTKLKKYLEKQKMANNITGE
jgi:hypothetical protein